MPWSRSRTLSATLVCVGGLGLLGGVYWFAIRPLPGNAPGGAGADPPPPPVVSLEKAPKVAPEKAPPAKPATPDLAPPPADGGSRDRAFRAASADDFIDRSGTLKGKWVIVPARVEKVEDGSPTLRLVHNRKQHTTATFTRENWPATPIGVDDEVEVVGLVSTATPGFASLSDCTLLGHTPAPPPTPLVVTAAEVIAAFDADPEAAAARFRSKLVRITGLVRGGRGQKGVTTALTVSGDRGGRHQIEVAFAPDQLGAVQTFPALTPLTAIGRFPDRPLSYANRVLIENAKFDPPRTGPVVVVPKEAPTDRPSRAGAEFRLKQAGAHFDYDGPEGKQALAGLRFFSTVRDHDLAQAAAFKELKSIHVLGPYVTDGVIEPLKGLTELRYLGLLSDKVGDAGLKHLAGFPKLERLNLLGAGVTDAGMKDVARVPVLKELVLRGTAVGDAGLKELAAAKGLTKLDVAATRVTDAGVRSFQAAVPGCKVER